MTLIPVIDDLACAAHGDCADIAPGVFRIGAVAEVIGSGSDEEILAAARACPAAAITVVRAEDGETVYP